MNDLLSEIQIIKYTLQEIIWFGKIVKGKLKEEEEKPRRTIDKWRSALT